MRKWLGLGAAGLITLLCCGGGAFAVLGLAVAGSQAVDEQARAVVGDYLEAIRDQDYDSAYDLLCDEFQRRESPERFTRREMTEPTIISYRVGETSLTDGLVVPVRVTYSGGGQDTLRVYLAQDGRTGTFEVCGVE